MCLSLRSGPVRGRRTGEIVSRRRLAPDVAHHQKTTERRDHEAHMRSGKATTVPGEWGLVFSAPSAKRTTASYMAVAPKVKRETVPPSGKRRRAEMVRGSRA